MALFLCPKGHWLIRAMREGVMQRLALLPQVRGILSFSKESIPLEPPRERTRGLAPRPRTLAVCSSKNCTRCAVWVRCTWLRHESLRIVTDINRALLREARVTIAWRQTACRMRHCRARRGTGAKNDRVSGRFLLWESHRAPVRKLRCGA